MAPQVLSRCHPGLQHLASLSLVDGRDLEPDDLPGRMPCPQAKIQMQPLDKPPRLHELYFGTHRAWGALHVALWPLVVMSAQGASECAAAAMGAGSESSDEHNSASGVHWDSGRPRTLWYIHVHVPACSMAGIWFAAFGLQMALHN